MKRACSILLSVVILFCCFSNLTVLAVSEDAGSFSVINYNVAGLPGWITGADSKSNQEEIGLQLTALDYDLIAVQEDFGYHNYLCSNISGYPYMTVHSGGVPAGDGMNLFSKYPLFNETRVPWADTYGVLRHGSDELTPKGILYTVIELENGVYLDFYNIHADAFDDEGSKAARESNFRQLSAMIMENSAKYDRPIIVTGDFNAYSHLEGSLNSNFRKYFFDQLGLKDAWTEICNRGDYKNYEAWEATGHSWGRWDSVEMIMFKNGGGVELTVTDFAYQSFYNENGSSLSDHVAATASFSYKKTDGFIENSQPLAVKIADPIGNAIRFGVCVLADLVKFMGGN